MTMQECLQRWIKSSDIKRCELCKFPFVMQSKVNHIHHHDHDHNHGGDHHHHILVNMTIVRRQSLPHDCLFSGQFWGKQQRYYSDQIIVRRWYDCRKEKSFHSIKLIIKLKSLYNFALRWDYKWKRSSHGQLSSESIDKLRRCRSTAPLFNLLLRITPQWHSQQSH